MVSRSSWYVRHRYLISTIINKLCLCTICFDIVKRTNYSLWFVAVDALKALGEFGDGVGVLLAKLWGDGLMLDDLVFDLTLEFWQLGFAALVDLDLSGGGTSLFLKTVTKVLELASHICALLLGLREDRTKVNDSQQIHTKAKEQKLVEASGRGYFNYNGYSLLECKQYLVSTFLLFLKQ